MDEGQVQRIIEAVPEKLSRSRLEPYRQLIAELRRLRRTYREIAKLLGEKCQLRVSPAAVHNFVRLHLLRKRNRYKRQAPRSAGRTQLGPTILPERSANSNATKKESPPSDEEVLKRIAELKRRPAAAETSEKRFHYDENEPLHLLPETDKK